MAQLHVELTDEQLHELGQIAEQRAMPVAALIRAYIDYLLVGGVPVIVEADDMPTGEELAALARHSSVFDWLEDEPDLYTLEDGEPV